MKKYGIFILVTLLCVAVSAQSSNDFSLDNPGTPEERARKITQEMKAKLSLQVDQEMPIHALNLKYAQRAQREIIDQHLSTWRTLSKGQALNEEKEKELRKLLSASQWKAYEEMRSDQRKKMLKALFE